MSNNKDEKAKEEILELLSDLSEDELAEALIEAGFEGDLTGASGKTYQSKPHSS